MRLYSDEIDSELDGVLDALESIGLSRNMIPAVDAYLRENAGITIDRVVRDAVLARTLLAESRTREAELILERYERVAESAGLGEAFNAIKSQLFE